MNFPRECDAKLARERLMNGCESMKTLLAGLLDAKGRVAEEVHAIRKLGKSLRGGFALFGLGKSSAVEIRAIGRLLSGPRDAVSRLSTWNKLAWVGDTALSAAILGLLDQQTHSAARRPPPETIDWCVARVNKAQQALVNLSEEQITETIARGLSKLEKRTLKRCRRLDHRAEEDFHEARKALKAWLGAAGFLPEGALTMDPEFHELADVLGDENDLATLSEWLDDHGFSHQFAPGLWQTIKEARHRLQKKAIKDGAKLATPHAA